MKALRVFLPQLICAALSTVGATAWAALEPISHVICVPVAMVTVGAGLVACVGALAKAADYENCAARLACWDCQRHEERIGRLTRERDEANQALATLRLPE